MQNRSDIWLYIFTGVIGATLFIFIFFYTYFETTSDAHALAMRCVLLIKDWQTLISGGLALAGAVATVFMIRKQIDESKKDRVDDKHRAFLAERARLPQALSTIVEFSEKSLKLLQPAISFYEFESDFSKILDDNKRPSNLPKYPSEAEERVSQFIATCEQKLEINNTLSLLLAAIQIHKSRMSAIERNKSKEMVFSQTIFGLVSDALEIHRIASHAIAYARVHRSDFELTKQYLATPDNMHLLTDAVFSSDFEAELLVRHRSTVSSIIDRQIDPLGK